MGWEVPGAWNCRVPGIAKLMFPRTAANLLNAWPTHLDIRINTSMVNKYIDGESIGKTGFGEVAHQKWSGR
jgi:hypothetical protein